MSKEEVRDMKIANCRICTLCSNHCADCPLKWALRIITAERFENSLNLLSQQFIENAQKSLNLVAA